MSILNLDEIKRNYENKSSEEAKLIINLIEMVNIELQINNGNQNKIEFISKLLDREKKIVDKLLAVLDRQ